MSHACSQLRASGVAVLRQAFDLRQVETLQDAATRLFAAIEDGWQPPDRYHYSRPAHAARLEALLDFGLEGERLLLGPLETTALAPLFTEAIGDRWACRMEQCYVRKKFPPQQAREAGCAIQDWHQDGALGVLFPPQPGPVGPMTELVTVWVPLTDCGVDRPGLEFVRRRQPALLHFTELTDVQVRERFAATDFCTFALHPGDALVFCCDVLHRTHATPDMSCSRLSVEYRIFPL